MLKLRSLVIGAGIAVALSACAQGQNTAATAPAPAPAPVDQAAEAAKAKVAQDDANRKLIMSTSGISMDQRLALMSPDYTQHNPADLLFNQVNGVNGYDGFKLRFETMAKMRGGAPFGPPPAPKNGPQPPPNNMMYKVLADGDLVVMIHERYLPMPGAKGQFYPSYSFDMMRIKDGKMVEHWDGMTIPDKLPPELKEPVSKLKFPKQAAQPS